MSVQQMRAAIYKVYRSDSWHRKVLNMDDVQVIAVYYSFLEKGKFDKPADIKPPKVFVNEKGTDTDVFKPFIGEQLKFDI